MKIQKIESATFYAKTADELQFKIQSFFDKTDVLCVIGTSMVTQQHRNDNYIVYNLLYHAKVQVSPTAPEDEQRKAKILEACTLKVQGYSIRQIAQTMGVGKSTVQDWITKYKYMVEMVEDEPK